MPVEEREKSLTFFLVGLAGKTKTKGEIQTCRVVLGRFGEDAFCEGVGCFDEDGIVERHECLGGHIRRVAAGGADGPGRSVEQLHRWVQCHASPVNVEALVVKVVAAAGGPLSRQVAVLPIVDRLRREDAAAVAGRLEQSTHGESLIADLLGRQPHPGHPREQAILRVTRGEVRRGAAGFALIGDTSPR